MKKLEEIIMKEKCFLMAAATVMGAKLLDAVTTSWVIGEKVATDFYVIRAAAEKYELTTPAIHTLSNKYAAIFEGNPLASRLIEEYGLNGGLFFQSLIVMVPALMVTYFLNKKFPEDKIGNKILYGTAITFGLLSINNIYQR